MKRITLSALKKYDQENDTSSIRLLEMTVDRLIDNHSYSLQFWKDMELYGIAEATTYLKEQFPNRDFLQYDRVVAQIKTEIESNEQKH